jgi:O-antigen biosynthesis protein
MTKRTESTGDQSHGPIIVGGMHRSGTSLAASLLASVGVHMGDELLGPARGNQRGHFEDMDVYSFHTEWLAKLGFNEAGFLDTALPPLPPAARTVAEGWLARRSSTGRVWGWKEPRTTLFLEFWRELAPGAKFLFVFRKPWEVADSLYRRGDALFQQQPEFALRVWARYNQAVLDFVARWPDDCMLMEIDRLATDPVGALGPFQRRFALPQVKPANCYDRELLQRLDSPEPEALVRVRFPAVFSLYADLCRQAGEPPPSEDGRDWEAIAARAATPESDAFVTWATHQSRQAPRGSLSSRLAYRCRRLLWKLRRSASPKRTVTSPRSNSKS